MEQKSIVKDKKILVIEDEPMLLEMYQVAFETAGLNVLTAPNGETGWQVIQQTPDLVLLDVKMDDISGLEILKRLQDKPELKNNLIIWMLSNVGEEAVSQETLRLGAEEYIMKTKITPSELVAKIKARLGI